MSNEQSNLQDLLLSRKFGHELFYVYCPTFCGQIFERAANLGVYTECRTLCKSDSRGRTRPNFRSRRPFQSAVEAGRKCCRVMRDLYMRGSFTHTDNIFYVGGHSKNMYLKIE